MLPIKFKYIVGGIALAATGYGLKKWYDSAKEMSDITEKPVIDEMYDDMKCVAGGLQELMTGKNFYKEENPDYDNASAASEIECLAYALNPIQKDAKSLCIGYAMEEGEIYPKDYETSEKYLEAVSSYLNEKNFTFTHLNALIGYDEKQHYLEKGAKYLLSLIKEASGLNIDYYIARRLGKDFEKASVEFYSDYGKYKNVSSIELKDAMLPETLSELRMQNPSLDINEIYSKVEKILESRKVKENWTQEKIEEALIMYAKNNSNYILEDILVALKYMFKAEESQEMFKEKIKIAINKE